MPVATRTTQPNRPSGAHRYRLSRHQIQFVSSPARRLAFIGAIGSGKTTAGAYRVLSLLQGRPASTLGMVIAPSYRMLADATLRTCLEVWRPFVTQINRTSMTVSLMLQAEHEVLFRSASDPDRLRGPNLHWVWIDEAALCPPQTWEIALGRLRAGGEPGFLWITTTPKGRNWLYQKVGSFDQIVRATIDDNPFLAPEFVATVKATYQGIFARQELYAEFVTAEGLIYAFDATRHVADPPPPPYARVIAGVDWGFNVAVVLVLALTVDGTVWVLDEWYARRVTIEEHIAAAQELRTAYGIELFYCDPAMPAYLEQFTRAGLPVAPAVNDFLPGISTVTHYLETGRLFVAPSCVNTIAEFESYAWRRRRDGAIVKERPALGQPDHAMDALRYAMHSALAVASRADAWLAWLQEAQERLKRSDWGVQRDWGEA